MSVTPIFRVLQILLIFSPNANPNDQYESFSSQTAGSCASTFARGPPVARSSVTSLLRRILLGQITCALHARDLIRLQVVLVSIVFKPTAIQNLSVSPVALIGNSCLAAFIRQQNKLLLGMVVHDLVCQSSKQS